MEDSGHHYLLICRREKNQIFIMHADPEPGTKLGAKREGGGVSQHFLASFLKLFHETFRSCRIILGDKVADAFKIFLGSPGKPQAHLDFASN